MASWVVMMYVLTTFYADYCFSTGDTFADIDTFNIEELMNEVEAIVDAKVKRLEARLEKEISTLKEEFKKKETEYKLIIENLQSKVNIDPTIEQEIANISKVSLNGRVLKVVYSNRKLKPSSYRRSLTSGGNSRTRSQVLNNNRRQISAEGEDRVAFFASIRKDQSHLGTNQDILFDNVVTNLGSAYNGHHGTFIAPVAGTYVFCATLHASGVESWGHFMVNGAIIAKIHLKGVQSSQTVIVHLNRGDDVSIQNTALDKGLHGDLYSTFGGFLLYRDILLGTEIIG